ncbi:imelysin family protein [Roseovarius mucosus]|uniref:imelysin family protein n=1 Tax=Roseovarius mucosus TaxID=215743 RepID=UPI001C607B49|nr:imelysin family protein [Roseovarius mucosus]MBW4974159.1 imelysin family protein [Roseovarius mucosus]
MRLITTPVLSLSLVLCLAAPSLADVKSALDAHILPAFARFAESADALAETAGADCRPEAMAEAYHTAFDAWIAVSDLRIGPSETGALSVAFWPDGRGSTPRALAQLIAEEDPVAFDPKAYAEVSIAARGLFALDMLMFDPEFSDYAPQSYGCTLAATIAADLALQAHALEAAWSGPFADTLQSAGADGNTAFLTPDEALRAIYTQILTSLEFTADTRLGLPMGTFDQPRPLRAEARRSGRSLRNVVLAAEAAHGLASALADWPLPETQAALARLQVAAARITDPAFQDVTDPQARLRAEVLQQAVRGLQAAIEEEIGAQLGIAPGFNAQDGD